MVIERSYAVAPALEAYYSQPTPEERKRYRDRVIGIYMTAVNGNFIEFKRLLSRENKGANFGLGLGFTGLTSAATFASERTANILAAGASGLHGAQGQMSREVYFEKTLPALFAAMDANRTRVRANIFKRMQEFDSYSLTEAFSDLADYEVAASLDRAIETMTSETGKKAAAEQARFENVMGLGAILSQPQRLEIATLGNRIDALVPDRLGDLQKISAHLGLPTTGAAEDQATAIMDKLQSLAADDPNALSQFVTDMQSKGVDLTK